MPQEQPAIYPVQCPFCDQVLVTIASWQMPTPAEAGAGIAPPFDLILVFTCHACGESWQSVIQQLPNEPVRTTLTGTVPNPDGRFPVLNHTELEQGKQRRAAVAKIIIPGQGRVL